METFIQGLIMAFREGLEAFLIIVILLKFLEKSKKYNLKRNVWQGLFSGIFASLAFAAFLYLVKALLGGLDPASKIWESAASLVAVLFVVTFIIWMINHGSSIKGHVEGRAAPNLSPKGIYLIALLMVAREGVEIALFQFAGKYSLVAVLLGITLSIALVLLVYYSLVKLNVKTIFTITLVYLILQAGFLAGYSVHEGLSAAVDMRLISGDNLLFAKAFDLSSTVMNHKEGAVGIPLYAAFGWYSKPEWVQFILQYLLTLGLFGYWYIRRKG